VNGSRRLARAIIKDRRWSELRRYYPTLDDVRSYARRKVVALAIGGDNRCVAAFELARLYARLNAATRTACIAGSASSRWRRAARAQMGGAAQRDCAIYWSRSFTESGGLISFGPFLVDEFRRAASYVDRIMKGEKPGDLPVQAPVRFELVINLKATKALGLTVPPTLITRADDLIE